MSEQLDDENPLDPQETLRLITDEQNKASRSFFGDPLTYWGPWGVAWLIGFGLLFCQYGLNGKPYLDLPQNLPLIVLFCLMAAAMAITTLTGVRSSRDIQGDSNTQGMMYGLSWFLGFVSVVAIGLKFGDMVPQEQSGLLWAALAVGLTGALYLAGSAIWQDWSMFTMGLWLTVVNAVGVTLGAGWHALLVSVAAGGGLLIAGVVLRIHHRRAARS